MKSFEAGFNEGEFGLGEVIEDKVAEFVDGGEIFDHLFLEGDDLLLGHLIFGKIEDFLREHFEDGEIIFADVHVFFGGFANVINKGGPC